MRLKCWATEPFYVRDELVHTAACSFAAEDQEATQHDEISLKVHDRDHRFLS
jgi:hypothetical protein